MQDRRGFVEAIVDAYVDYGGERRESLLHDPVRYVRSGDVEHVFRGNEYIDVTGKSLCDVLVAVEQFL